MCPLLTQQRDPDEPYTLLATSAAYLKISPQFAMEFLDGFVPDTPVCVPIAYPIPVYTAVPHHRAYAAMPTPGVLYPALSRVVWHAGINAMRDMDCVGSFQEEPLSAGQQLQLVSQECQCAQYSLWPLLSMILAQSPECLANFSFEQQARIRTCARRGTGLHPNTVRQLLLEMAVFVQIPAGQELILDGARVTFNSILVPTDNTAHQQPDLWSFMSYRNIIHPPRNLKCQ